MDLERIVSFYKNTIKNTSTMNEYGRWVFGLHPTYEMIKDYVDNESMFLLEEHGVIIAAAAVTLSQDVDYHSISWTKDLNDNDVAVVHILCVAPEMQNSGIGREMMQFIIRFCTEERKSAIRLDALCCNIPAQRLYESLGFRKCGERNCYAANTGWITFYYFELIL